MAEESNEGMSTEDIRGLVEATQKVGVRTRPPGTAIDPLSGEAVYKAPRAPQREK